MSKRIGIITLGCKVNQYESEAIAEALRDRGFTVCDAGEVCDGYIVNTCTVTAEADRKARQMIRRAARLNPQAAIIVTGCTAEYSAEELAGIEGVIAVCGNAKKLECVDIIEKYFSNSTDKYPLICVSPVEEAEFEKMNLKAFPRTRAYIKIEDGCENKCAYCAIPKARGNVRSKLHEDVIREVSGFVDAGTKEVVLTGIETASYGKDIGVELSTLLKYIDAFVSGKCTVRLGSLDPSLFKEKFVNDIKGLKSLAPHFHISLQSGSSSVLALMRRKYNADGARAALARLREAIPNVMFTTDIIVGFPGETEENFDQTVEFVKEARFLMAHIFPYSEREGTPAAEMPESVPVEVRRERAARLTEIQNSVRDSILDEIIATEPEVKVLFETFSNGMASGHTANFLEVAVQSKTDLHGRIHSVKLKSHKDGICLGTLTSEATQASNSAVENKPQRKIGAVAGFRKCDDIYLEKIKNEFDLDASVEELHVVQALFEKVGRDPTAAELFFALAACKRSTVGAKQDVYLDTVSGITPDIEALLDDLVRRYLSLSTESKAPTLVSLAEFAATGKTRQDACGIDISLAGQRLAPPVYSDKSETVHTDKYAITVSGGRPISGSKIGDTCIVIAPKDGGAVEKFFDDAAFVCRKFLKEFPETKIVPASDRGLLSDVCTNFSGALFDTALLPTPSRFAEAICDIQAPAMLIFAYKRNLARLWEIATERGIVPCAPAVCRLTNISVHAAEGNVELDHKLWNDLCAPVAAVLTCDSTAVIEKSAPVSFKLPAFGCDMTVSDVGGDALYEDIADAMRDKNAAYAVSGILSINDPALLPALLALDAYRRNEHSNIVHAHFFIGDKTSLSIIKLTQKNNS
ncbi:MAG: tRNA (N(6)-L-threonylcarbamoyladenosine(37)-C(2))-methylthiotransferase MtaB [Eubacteriales bacterium]